ncbi:helix-turn-helix transcriptional regulator [Paraburkholderia caribensis]|uniref:helix-turn-helix transcriptional regulator n=1 Tax=Paraburkholderia caribensis TaxID=75105 RepID=UPI0034D2F90B
MNALNINQVATKVALGKSTIHRLVAKGEFPKPFPLVGNRVAWLDSDVDAWLEKRVEAARQQPETAEA